MEALISIVIPVYNAGTKINPCMRSLLAQTYKNVEIILVDDKSPDRSTVEILRDWTKKDTRVRLLEKDVNGGPRLDGIKIARGEYIVLIDQDDWMPKDAIAKMYKAAVEKEADVVIGQVSKVLKIGPWIQTFPPKRLLSDTGKVLEHDELMGEYFESYFGHNILPVSAWGKMYRKELFDKVDFPSPWPKVGADDLYMSMLLHPHIQRLIIIPDVVYSYLIGLPGASPKYLNGWLDLACVLFDLKWKMLEKYNFMRAYRYQAIEMVNYIKTFVRNCTIFDADNREKRLQQLVNALENPIWKRVHILKGADYKEQGLVEDILEKNARNIYETLEIRYRPKSLKERIEHSLLRLSAKFK